MRHGLHHGVEARVPSEGRSAFVTGGTGFLGRNLIEQLIRERWQVTALHRASSNLGPLAGSPVRLVEGDILEPAALRRAMPERVDALFHLAADISMWSRHRARQTRINVDGTRNVVDAALRARVHRFVHTSTWNTYGLEQGAISEDSPKLGGRSWINYDRSKLQAEEAVREGVARGLDAVILNPAHVIGRYDRHGWAQLIIAAHRRWLPGVPPGAGTFCHAEAVARAHIAAAERGRRGRDYLLSGPDASFVELFRAINEVTGSHVPLRPLPAWLFRLSARANVAAAGITGREPEATPEGVAVVCARARVVSSRAEQELGYRPASLDIMIDDSYRWLRSEGLLDAS